MEVTDRLSEIIKVNLHSSYSGPKEMTRIKKEKQQIHQFIGEEIF